MREIKFRAICNQNGYWYTAKSDEHSNLTQFFAEVLELQIEHYPVHINQFTGIKDKNGREIYEGDIIVFYFTISGGDPNRMVDAVYFDEGAFRIQNADPQFKCLLTNWATQSEVIGNIYENPDLLK